MKHIVLMPIKLPLNGFRDLSSDFELLIPDSSNSFNEELDNYLPIADALVSVFGNKVTEEMMSKAPKLKLIANYGVGYDNVDVDYATSQGIVVTNTPSPVTEPTAELAMLLMLALARNIIGLHNGILENSLPEWNVRNNLSTTLYNKTLGIIGMGAIGQALARRAKAFGMKIIYHNRACLDSAIEEKYEATYVSKTELLQKSDYVSIHVPFSQETYHLIGKEELKLMKNSAFLINTSRGKVIHEKVLIKALKNREIAGAGLDVFSNEPIVPDELKNSPYVVLTPHVGSGTHEARAEMSQFVADVISNFFNGHENDLPIVNPEALKSDAFLKRMKD
ncbi:NAD(P)-dependent oxidoreductase [Alkalitalea saponilacus]|uniref:Glyoxylate reductase n=1 Tax=Alkalitalea saponilacus TaxID=889453 RepID=A0A1T5H8B4_9BACT|nr:NAD(P)-dependent oxidoreductase [Alkalitalea saponilacus]ASB50843.1 hydroxyacid dehydrogenase [Alkalitalea saponilacus]SKC16926.1 glyoxylate reductase [Alkalitalea saponilacus]